jgi:hypothetical protein
VRIRSQLEKTGIPIALLEAMSYGLSPFLKSKMTRGLSPMWAVF